ncbi:MAG: lysophospholipid acyltransferase family protein [Gammaproteobacteria bacterium]|nr:lysophospholipid acyltransferase family protein [Gammaproteobacteria bacterium]
MTGVAKGLWRLTYGIWATLAFVVVTFSTILLLVVLPGEDRRRALVKRGASLIFLLFGASPQVHGRANLPDGPCVVVANHASYLDGIILTAVLPPRFSFVIKREMTRVPLAHFLLRRIGSLFVERSEGGRRSADARRILQQASQDRSLAFFPEGTFTAEPGLRPFRSGAFQAALRGRKPLAPIVIRGSRQMLPAGSWLPAPGRLEVEIQQPVPVDGDAQSAESLTLACRKRMLTVLGEPDLAAPDLKS